MVENILKMTIAQIRELLQKREISSVELTNYFLERIERYDGDISAYIKVTGEHALAMAKEADKKIASGEKGRLLGIPLGIKDIYCTKGIETTCASRILKGFIPPYDATVIRKLKDEGYVHLGRLNMDEFAMGSSTENSSFQTTKNPWDLSRIPGGSSGGSAAATAAGLCVASIGTDTGGSIRQPASLCGVVGMKPTYGRVSRYGLIAFASSLDQIGPVTRNVSDCATMMNAIAGHDPMDSTSIPQPAPDYAASLGRDIKGLRIGIPKEYFKDGMEKDVRKAVDESIALFEKQGASVVNVSLPHTEYAVATYYIICTAEASSNLARYDGVKYGLREPGKDIIDMYKKTRFKGFGKEVKRRIILGTYVLSSGYYDAYYRKASKVRTLIRKDFDEAFKSCDIIVTPVSPTTAFTIGERMEDPLAMYLSDIFTIPVNLAGLPGISVPCGFDGKGLPIGLQIIGKPLDEALMIQAAYIFEKERKAKKIPERYK
ncbi:MAG TPA: Asp-tRNA(Asn)/Glu-tRNA(Gln) amidotransferase subunit GatA [Syntrophorhabdaceae bacterium]|nr:Asp-tRNA(Asn)/Glu-tRNA(Gln) amidotransferase subunit GatA [Syntrophorhabdaceae bacterium]HNT68601.1 Asp-tRNA(Asn)/Glu-tRNA(Gln) amidotransferase subunit GatA [Syntrophorhabdaceae bacterium]